MIASAQTSNSKLEQINNKLTVQSQKFTDDSFALRSLDWDRSRFDIEFGLRNGTTYNSFCLLYTSPSPRDRTRSRMPSSA